MSTAADEGRQALRPRRAPAERGEVRSLPVTRAQAVEGLGEPSTAAQPAQASPAFEPLEGWLIVLPDEQLDALGAIFCQSPFRRSMTFEGYLAIKGYAREKSA